MTRTRPSEVGELAATAIVQIARRATASRPVSEYAEGQPLPWSILEDGGWDYIGVPEEADGGGASLRDLVEVSLGWGQFCLPLPLMETMWVKRWSPTARDSGGPCTVSVPRAGFRDGSGLAPYGGLADVAVARSLGRTPDELDVCAGGVAEPFAPAKRAVVLAWSTSMPADAADELGILWAAEAVGGAQRLLDLAVEYAKERVQFGKPIGSFQAIKHGLADMHTEVQLAESAVFWASFEPAQAARASTYAINAAIDVAQDAIQVHGAMGFTWELGLHYYLRNMLILRELVNGLWST